MLTKYTSHNAARSLKAPRTQTTIHLANLLVPVDFSAESKNTLRYACAFARQFGASLTLLHVVEPMVCAADFGYGPVTRRCPNPELLKKARARLNRLGKRAAAAQLKPVAIARTGVAETEIIEAARDLEADLIVMGTHGNREPGQAQMGSTAEIVVRRAPCPVIVVRPKEHAFASGGKLR